MHHTPFRNVTLAMPEPIGVIGIVCPDDCAAARLRLARAAGRSPWATRSSPSRPSALPLAATDLYQVLDTSDVPGGVVNIVTGVRDALAQVLAEHDDVDGVWYFGSAEGSAEVERLRPAT